MHPKYQKQLLRFLREYVDPVPGALYTDEAFIHQGIGELICQGIFSAKELQKEILKECSIIISTDDLERLGIEQSKRY